MGEVFLAWDDRLKRHVAIKRIRHDVQTTPDRRRRFRREARVAAALSCPAIVQVYDILEDAAGDSIVMEYVKGRSLAELQTEGAVDAAMALRLARQVTEGLISAHGAGLIHRDLKAENVMVTPENQAKILDFGLAKVFTKDQTNESLTADGAVLGTVRAMSPEQAGGKAVDARSDLYSLGVLLYEMLTGVTPFRGENALQVHHKVLTERPPPPRALRPELPAELSGLIENLLAKNPEHRPQSGLEVAEALELCAALPGLAELGPMPSSRPRQLSSDASTLAAESHAADPHRATPPEEPSPVASSRWRGKMATAMAVALALVLSVAVLKRSAGDDFLYVAVAEPRITGQALGEDADLVVSAVKAATLDGLLALERVVPLTADEIDPAPTSVAELARVLAAREVVTTRLDCRRRVCQVMLRRLAAGDRQVLEVASFQIPSDDFFLIASAVASHLPDVYPRHRRRPGVGPLAVSGEDYEHFLRLLRGYQDRSLEPQKVLAGLADLRGRAPRFVESYAVEVSIRYDQYFHSRDGEELAKIFELLEQARRLAPENPRFMLQLSTIAIESGRLDLATEVLSELERLEPGDARVLAQHALLQERRGEAQTALASMRTSVARRPSWDAIFDLALMEYRQGEIDAARQTLEGLLQRFPEHFRGRSFLAQLELVKGRPARAEELYRRLVERAPGVAELSNLGLAQMLQGRYREAVENARRSYDLAPGNPGITLNLADAEFLAGEEDQARKLYLQVVELGEAEAAPGWQQLTVKAQALAHLGHQRDAVTAIQKALQLAPHNPQAAYEAAVVYALVGERTSALVHAEKALVDFSAPWLALPWFDTLRDDPRFRRLVQR